MKRAIIALSIAFAAVLVCGCESMEKWLPDHGVPKGHSNDWTLEAFNDIDLPHGYIVVPDESYTYICPWWDGVRIARLVLLGDTRVDVMLEYYIHSLESVGWVMVAQSAMEYDDESTATFKQPATGETIELTVSRDAENRIKVELAVSPEYAAAPVSPPQP